MLHLPQPLQRLKHPPQNELWDALQTCRHSFLFAALFSLFINLLMLVPAMYMLQVYDRVLASGSIPTLLMLTILVIGLFVIMGSLEAIRARILVRISARLDVTLNTRLFNAVFDANLQGRTASAQAIEDLTQLRQFLTGNSLFGFFDIPWMPIYIGVLYLLHPWLAILAIFGSLLLIVIATINNLMTKDPLAKANTLAIQNRNFIQGNLRNADSLEAMGMLAHVRTLWLQKHHQLLRLQAVASDHAGALSSLGKTLRMALQSLVLGLGAFLAVRHEMTPGMMIAGSIILGRALAPIDLLIGSWKGFLSARTAYRRISDLLQTVPIRPRYMSLPAPDGRITLENVFAGPPGAVQPVLRGIRFDIAAGEIVGIIGPSAAGKSTLARVLLGIWPAAAGKVRLSGADIGHWNRDELGPYVGYLPQDIELFDGTVSENIARFGTIDPQLVIAAAQRAQIHEMILKLPKGYDTPIGLAGAVLSGGQRQRIGLARAMYGDPVLVVLDEPNSNLDDQGEAALVAAVLQLRQEGSTVFIITHRLNILKSVDKIIVLRDGLLDHFGDREQILAQFARPAPVASQQQRFQQHLA
jgi:ATP-binding cassette subfamily C protein EexD